MERPLGLFERVAMFSLKSSFKPAGDQPEAIKKIINGFLNDLTLKDIL